MPKKRWERPRMLLGRDKRSNHVYQYSVGNMLQNHSSVGKVPVVSQNSITEVDKQISNINVAKNALLTLGYINEDMIPKN